MLEKTRWFGWIIITGNIIYNFYSKHKHAVDDLTVLLKTMKSVQYKQKFKIVKVVIYKESD